MAFERPVRTKNYLDLYEETKRGPRLLAFRVLDVDLPPEEGRYPDPQNPGQKSKVYPVLADVMVIDGPNAGTCFMRKVYKYAITNALRGADSSDPNPTVVPGAEIAIRAERGRGTNSNAVFGNEPDDEELETIERTFEEYGGWPQPAATPGPRQPEPATRPGPTTRTPAPIERERPAVQRPGPVGPAGPVRRPGPAAAQPAAAAAPARPAQQSGSGSARPFGPRRG
jgi:hypothetical protein